MSRVLVVSDDGRAVVEVVTDDNSFTTAVCAACGDSLSDRGHFEDTVQVAEIHVDREH